MTRNHRERVLAALPGIAALVYGPGLWERYPIGPLTIVLPMAAKMR